MFQGTTPRPLRAMIREVSAWWDCAAAYIGCSGNYTLERVLAGRFALHGNDVGLYSVMAGRYFAGEDLELHVRGDRPEWAWLEPYLSSPASKLATVLLASRAVIGVGDPNPYYQRQHRAWREAWPAKHAETMALLPQLHLASFTAGDVVAFAESGDRDAAFLAYPPTFEGGYETQFRYLERVFAWDGPTYPKFDRDAIERLLAAAGTYRYWLLMAGVELDAPLMGLVQITNRAAPVYVYGNAGPLRLVQPRQPIAPLGVPPLMPGDEIRGALRLVVLTEPQLNELRSVYLDPLIAPATISLALALLSEDRVLGAFAVSRMGGLYKSRDSMSAYLMSDFAVAPTDYPRLSKLVLMAAMSREAQLLIQRRVGFPVYELWTTAFTKGPVSMKYRGLFRLHRRRDSEDPAHPYQLEYRAPAGGWTLEEAYARWQTTTG